MTLKGRNGCDWEHRDVNIIEREQIIRCSSYMVYWSHCCLGFQVWSLLLRKTPWWHLLLSLFMNNSCSLPSNQHWTPQWQLQGLDWWFICLLGRHETRPGNTQTDKRTHRRTQIRTCLQYRGDPQLQSRRIQLSSSVLSDREGTQYDPEWIINL